MGRLLSNLNRRNIITANRGPRCYNEDCAGFTGLHVEREEQEGEIMSQIKRLGMGLGALIGGEPEPVAVATVAKAEPASTMEINTIRPNPYQPRTEFDTKDIESLAESLKKDGLLQPVVVRPAGAGFFQLVAGERRWRAAKLAGLARVPVIIREVEDKKMLELALVENIQRRDLNP